MTARAGVLVGLGALTTLLAVPALAEEVFPAGSEFRVSRGNANYYSYTYDGRASDPDVARLPNGQFVVVWQETAQSYVGYNLQGSQRVAARRFDRDGTGAGQQFSIFQQEDDDNLYGRLFHPSVAGDPDDGFVVVWGNNYDASPPDFGRVWAQRFDAANDPVAPRFQVNTAEADTYQQQVNEVATDASGGFLVTWDSHAFDPLFGGDVVARRYDGSDVPLGPEFKVNTDPIAIWGYPDVGSDAAGNFVVAWSDFGDVPGGFGPAGTFAQPLDSTGALVGPEIEVFPHDNDETKNKLAVAPSGDFMVVGWGGPVAGTPGRIFDAAGAPLTPEFAVDPSFGYASVAADPDGNFVVVWMDYSDDSNIFGRRFSPTGVPLGAKFQVSVQPQYAVFEWPIAATDEDGDFVVVWNNDYYGTVGNQDIALHGIWGRRFAVCGNARIGPDDGCDDGNTTALDGCSATCNVETCHACVGEPSSCTPFPGCTAVCTNPAPIQPNTTALSFKGIGAPLGDEGMTFKGKVANPPLTYLQYDPSADGIELALTTSGLVYGIFGSTAIPPGLPGSGCDPNDGWKVKPGSYVYKNVSNALPPGCAPGSAGGVRLVKVKDKLDRDGTVQFRVKARNATIGTTPVPPLVATVILGTSPTAGAAGRCGQIIFTGAIGTRFFP